MNRRIVSIFVAALLVVGVIATIILSVNSRSGPADVTQESSYSGDCISVTVAASSEKAALLTQAADTYNKSGAKVDSKCIHVQINTKASGGAETALSKGWDTITDGPAPTVWAPASSTWLALLISDSKKLDKPSVVKTGGEYDPVSILKTPLVLAMPEPQARALGWPDKPIGWQTLATLARDPKGWGSVGHPEWGQFTLGKTSPDLSTSGLAATVGAFVAATGKTSDLTEKDLKDPQTLATVTAVENAAVHYGDTTLTFLSNLLAADDKGRGLTYVSAVAVEEKSVVDYNRGNPSGSLDTQGKHNPPKVKLVAVYPSEGTLYSDNPYIILSAPWVTADQQAAALDFRKFLLKSDAQKIFTDAGFRTFDGKAGEGLADSSFSVTVPVRALNAPSGDTLAQIRSLWHDIRKKARVMLVLDVSGSMGEQANSGTKLEEARTAALQALGQLNPQDEIGLSIFTTGLPGGSQYQTLVPLGPVSSNGPKIGTTLQSLVPLNGTPLYTATRDTVKQVKVGATADRINAVVILTDGKNEAADDNLDGLLTDLATMTSPEASGGTVRVFTIAYGPDADLTVLQKISEAGGGKAYDARKPGTINDVFTTVISNF